MSEENVEVLVNASKAANAATSVEERARFLEILDPEVEWITREGPPDLQGEFHGIEQVRQFYARWASAWRSRRCRRRTSRSCGRSTPPQLAAATVMALYDPEVEWDNSIGLGGTSGGGVYRGYGASGTSSASGARHGSTPRRSLRSCSTRAST
jgi:hypothetical protein